MSREEKIHCNKYYVEIEIKGNNRHPSLDVRQIISNSRDEDNPWMAEDESFYIIVPESVRKRGKETQAF